MSLLNLFGRKTKEPKKPIIKQMTITREVIWANDIDPQSIIEPLWWLVSIYEGPEKYETDLSRFSLPQRYVFAVQRYIDEVENGGHDDFFFNPTGIVWQDALKGLREIGHPAAEAILQKAINIMGGNPPLSHTLRQDYLDEHDTDFEDLDYEFYDISDLERTIMTYIRMHIDEFCFDGSVEIPQLRRSVLYQ